MKLKVGQLDLSLKLNMAAMRKFKGLTGKSLFTLDQDQWDEEIVSGLIYCAQFHKGNQNVYSQEQIDDELDFAAIQDVIKALVQVKAESLPKNAKRPVAHPK